MADPFDPSPAPSPPAGPIRIGRLTAHAVDAGRHYKPGYEGDRAEPFDDHGTIEVQITVDLEPVCPNEEWPWWSEQLRRLGITPDGGQGSREGHTKLHFRVKPPDVQVTARELIAAIDAAAVGYPENFEAWRRERDEKRAAKKRRQDESSAPYQAILDTVMDQYRSGEHRLG